MATEAQFIRDGEMLADAIPAVGFRLVTRGLLAYFDHVPLRSVGNEQRYSMACSI